MNLDCFTVYVLYSSKSSTLYTGFTSNLIKRFHDHNFNNTSGYTVKYRPWKVLYTEVYFSKNEAKLREKYLKTGAGRDFIKKNVFPIYSDLW
jgi:putative endonuclease